jgi:predicted Zn finger-like uncharacterized protein
MIISCINCDKKFNVDSELIPKEGRTIQCGSCNHIWFFNKNDQNNQLLSKPIFQKIQSKNIVPKDSKITSINNLKIDRTKNAEIIEYQPSSKFTFTKLLSYIMVLIISFVGLVIILDTFKSQFYNIFPNLEFFLFSLFETLKDIELFIRDLI